MSQKQRLDQLLVQKGLADNRSKAAALIMAGRVKVGDKVIDKAGYFVKVEAPVSIDPGPSYVSRAGEKLASVAGKLKLNFRAKIVLDVGSSTGGFTDFALQNGAKRVYAVDVGTNQLDWKLRQDTRVVVMEKTDIRDVKTLPEPIDIVVIDVSFISLRQILPAVKKLTNPQTLVVPMAKPQFEADYKTASLHKGVIKNDTIRRRILKDLENHFKPDFLVAEKADSEIAGSKGNVERFYLLEPTR